MEDDFNPFVITNNAPPPPSAGYGHQQHQPQQAPPPPQPPVQQQQDGGAQQGYDDGQGEATHEGGAPVQDAAATEEELQGLVPVCVRHHEGPKLNPAVYGYDLDVLKDKPWARRGANTSDYFNYGFNETSWRAYCAMQPNGGPNALKLQADANLQRQIQLTNPGGMSDSNMGGFQRGGVGGGAGGGFRSGGADRPMMRPNEGPRPADPTLWKTKICRQFMEGHCQYGDSCTFAHGENEIRAPKPMGGGGMMQPLQFQPPQAGGWGSSGAQGGGAGGYARPMDGGGSVLEPPGHGGSNEGALPPPPVLQPPMGGGEGTLPSPPQPMGGFRMPQMQ